MRLQAGDEKQDRRIRDGIEGIISIYCLRDGAADCEPSPVMLGWAIVDGVASRSLEAWRTIHPDPRHQPHDPPGEPP